MNPKNASHQDLSNFIWKNVGIMGRPMSFAAIYVAEIIDRFNSKILPYRPNPRNMQEIDHLLNTGLIYVNDMEEVLIIYDNKIIGEVLPPTHPLYMKGGGL